MGWNGNGVVVRSDGTRTGANVWTQAKNAPVKIKSADHDAHDEDMADAIEKCLNRDGENAMAANLKMGTNILTGLGAGSARTESLNLGQAQDGAFLWGGESSGENVVTISVSPAITAYANGMRVWFQKNATANSANVVININGVGQKSLLKAVGVEIPPGELPASALCCAVYLSSTDAFYMLSGLATPAALPRGWIDGYQMANGTDADHDLDIGAGSARDGADSVNIALASAITKQFDSGWAVGTGQGGMQSGSSLGNNEWNEVHAIKRTDTGVVDVIAVPAGTSLSLPADYDKSRRIGYFRTDGSANILGFTQDGDRFFWDTPVEDLAFDNNGSAAGTLQALTVPPSTLPIFAVYHGQSGATRYWLFSSPDAPNITPGSTVYNHVQATSGISTAQFEGTIQADSSSRIRHRATADSVSVGISTRGWIDRRGKDA